MIQYPASVGRDFDEVLRVIDGMCPVESTFSFQKLNIRIPPSALQASDKYKVSTPVSWKPGQDVIIPTHISDEQAKVMFNKFETVLVRHTLRCLLSFLADLPCVRFHAAIHEDDPGPDTRMICKARIPSLLATSLSPLVSSVCIAFFFSRFSCSRPSSNGDSSLHRLSYVIAKALLLLYSVSLHSSSCLCISQYPVLRLPVLQ